MYCKAKQFVTKSLPIGVKLGKTNLIVSTLEQNDGMLVENGNIPLRTHRPVGMKYYLLWHEK